MKIELTNYLLFWISVMILFYSSIMIWIGRRIERKNYLSGYDKIEFGEIQKVEPKHQFKAEYDIDKNIITMHYGDGLVEEFQKNESDCWIQLPMLNRIPARQELELNDVMRYIKKYGNPYPYAHQKTTGHESKQN